MREPQGLIHPAVDTGEQRARHEAEADGEGLAHRLEPPRRRGQRIPPPLVVGGSTARNRPSQLGEGHDPLILVVAREAKRVVETRLDQLEVALQEGLDRTDGPRHRPLAGAALGSAAICSIQLRPSL